MKNYILFDTPSVRQGLLPITYTRPVAAIRVGIRTIAEKWSGYLNTSISYLTDNYLQQKYQLIIGEDNVLINGSILPNEALVTAIQNLDKGASLVEGGVIIATRIAAHNFQETIQALQTEYVLPNSVHDFSCSQIRNLPDIFSFNPQEIKADFECLTKGRISQPITDRFTAYYHENQIFIEEGASLKACILNAELGPIYIGRNAQIQEGAIIQGPFGMGEGSVVSLGAKIRSGVSIGSGCKVGGEVSMTIFQGNANKGHDGYLGCSYVGEWCNLGANTNNSNLKNDWTNVKLYHYPTKALSDTGKQFVGTFLADYARAGICTMFNTGTVVGVSVNVFGSGFQPKHISSFSWGGAETGFEEFRFEKALQVARASIERRHQHLSPEDEAILRWVFEHSRED